MSENQKLREALQAISHIDDTTNHSVDASAALDRIGQIARQALALPTEPAHADTWGISRAMVTLYAYECDGLTAEALALPTADHLPDAGKMVEAAAPVGERELFERTMMDKYGWQNEDFKLDDFGYFDGQTDTAWMAWQARAALSAGDAADAQRYRWLMDNCTLGIKQNGVGWSLNTTACIAPDCIKDVGTTIDAAMRKGQL